MTHNQLLDITLQDFSLKSILEQIQKHIELPTGFYHIVSLNPENLVVAQSHNRFRAVLEAGNLKLADGNGIIIAAKILGLRVGERVTGVSLMEQLLDLAGKMRFRVMLIGGAANLAASIAECYRQKYPEADFYGIQGIRNIQGAPDTAEQQDLFRIVADRKPQIVFVAFGSPFQELWLDQHRQQFQNCVCMGVGGAFDFVGGAVKRAPQWVQQLGLEWLYRLLHQPWRWKRQLRLLRFMWLIARERFIIKA